MPSFLPENNVILASDSEWRLLVKWCDKLYQAVGNKPSPYPEGTQPLASDSEHRLWEKITIMRNS